MSKTSSVRGTNNKFLSEMLKTIPKTLLDAESLYNESLILKAKLNNLSNENTELKQRLEELEEQVEIKNLLISKSSFHSKSSKMIPRLKNSLKNVKEKLISKEAQVGEMKMKVKINRNLNSEGEIQEKIRECISLKEKLIQALGIGDNPEDPASYEEKINMKKEEVSNLKRINDDYLNVVKIIDKELNAGSSRIMYLELINKKKKKQKNLHVLEIKKAKAELQVLSQQKEELAQSHGEIITKLQESIHEMNCKIAQNTKLLLETESSTQEKIDFIEKAKRINNTYRNALKRARTMNVIEIETPKKFINPPKFFKKIFKIINKKNMLIDVFLSLIDKNNKRMLSIDEAVAAFEPLKIKKRYILNALTIMGCSDKYVRVDKIQEWYEKYDYETEIEDFPSIIEEEIRAPINPSSPLESFAIAEEKTLRSFNTMKDYDLINYAEEASLEFKALFEEIAEKMEKLQMPKEKLIEVLLGQDFDSTVPVFYEDLENRLLMSPLDLKNNPKVSELARALCDSNSNVTSKIVKLAKHIESYFHNC